MEVFGDVSVRRGRRLVNITDGREQVSYRVRDELGGEWVKV